MHKFVFFVVLALWTSSIVMGQSYTYEYDTDFTAFPSVTQSTCDLHALSGQIEAQPNITHTLVDYYDTDTNVTFVFDGALLYAEQTALTYIINTYVFTQTYIYYFATDFTDLVGNVLDQTIIAQEIYGSSISVALAYTQPIRDVNGTWIGEEFVFYSMLAPLDIIALTTVINHYVYVYYTDDTIVAMAEMQAPGTNGGNCNAGSWAQRVLTASTVQTHRVRFNPALGQFTLYPGTYIIRSEAPAYNVGMHKGRIFQLTSPSGPLSTGTSEVSVNGVSTKSTTLYYAQVEITSTYQIEHYCTISNGVGTDWGVATSDGSPEHYASVIVFQLA